MKLKNINRGLVLGGVLILGVVGYVGKGQYDFRNDKPVIKQTVEECINDLVKSNKGDETQLLESWKSWVNSYYVEYTNEKDYSFKKSEFLKEISAWESSPFTGTITDGRCEVGDITISKYGEHGAKVSVNYSLYYEFIGEDARYMSFYGTWNLGNVAVYYDEYGNEIKSDENTKYSVSYDGNAELYMIETENGWKIASSDCSDFSGETKTLDDDSSVVDTSATDTKTDDSSAADSQQTESKAEEVSESGE
jgi:hypothetical protein